MTEIGIERDGGDEFADPGRIRIMDIVEKLLGCLDEDIERMKEVLSQIDEMRGLVVKRDEVSLCRLLEDTQVRHNDYKEHESMRKSLRKQLSIALGFESELITLSQLEDILPQEQSSQVAEKRVELRILTDKVKKEYLSTTLLLAECARFNRELLNSIFDTARPGIVTYNSSGSSSRQDDTAFVNLQL